MYRYYIQIGIYLQLSFQWLLGIFEFPVWIGQVQVVEHDHDENRLFLDWRRRAQVYEHIFYVVTLGLGAWKPT